MKRWLARIFVFLLLGAIVNIAVAWSCSLWVPSHEWWSLDDAETNMPSRIVALTPAEWLAEPEKNHAFVAVDISRSRGFGIEETVLTTTLHDAAAGLRFFGWDCLLCVVAAGWPTHAIEASMTATAGRPLAFGVAPHSDAPWHDGWVSPIALHATTVSFTWFEPSRPIPYGVIWPGFAINTIFYAVGAVVVVRSPVRIAKKASHQTRPVPELCV